MVSLLLIGGTSFVGRHMAEEALRRGWSVTLFHRGRTREGGLEGAENVIGDRLADLSMLQGRTWDYLIDTSAYFPRAVDLLGEILAGATRHQVFISTISVYADPNATLIDSPKMSVEDPAGEVVNNETYGGLKVLCEAAFHRHFPGGWILRPGIIAGPYDPTDRFTYWVVRDRAIPPARPDQPVQFIDARALAAFALDGLEAGHRQTVNTVGPAAPITLGEIAGTGDAARAEDVVLPLELPESHFSMFQVDPGPAIALGLRLPEPAETIRATREWWATVDRPLKFTF